MAILQKTLPEKDLGNFKHVGFSTLQSIVKDDPSDKIDVEIGDIKSAEDFLPQAKIRRWDNEVNASFRIKDDELLAATGEVVDGKIKFVGEKKEAHIYELEPNAQMQDGGLEFEIILKEKPATNKIEFTIETKGLDFFYQPEISDEEAQIDLDRAKKFVKEMKGKHPDEWLDALPTTLEQAKRRKRPINVVGSYAVYHKNKTGDYSQMYGKNYKSGKAFHIYRPRIEDAEGSWVWGELNVDVKNKLLTVTIPQQFLDNAVYPVVVDPTFGYTNAGESWEEIANLITGVKATGASGTLNSITGYIFMAGSPWEIRLGIYRESDDSLVDTCPAKVAGDSGWELEDEPSWHTADVESGATISAVDYLVCCWGEGLGTPLHYDTGSSGDGASDSETYASSFPDPANFTSDDKLYSIYCTYTASASSSIKKISGVAQASIGKVSGVAEGSIGKVAGVSNQRLISILNSSIIISWIPHGKLRTTGNKNGGITA